MERAHFQSGPLSKPHYKMSLWNTLKPPHRGVTRKHTSSSSDNTCKTDKRHPSSQGFDPLTPPSPRPLLQPGASPEAARDLPLPPSPFATRSFASRPIFILRSFLGLYSFLSLSFLFCFSRSLCACSSTKRKQRRGGEREREGRRREYTKGGKIRGRGREKTGSREEEGRKEG